MSLMKSIVQIAGFALCALLVTPALAQSYGPALDLATAKKIAAGALAEAAKNNWKMAIAIVDNHGMLVYYERMDDTQTGSVAIALDKARTGAMFRRPSRVFEEGVAKGRVALLGLQGATPITGGLPIVVGGKTVGGIGISGASSDQDEQTAAAGLAAIK